MIEFICSECQKRYKAEQQFSGRTVICERCKAKITIPAVQETAQTPPLQQESVATEKSPALLSPPKQSSTVKSLVLWMGIVAGGVLVIVVLFSIFASKRKASLVITEKAKVQILALKSEADSLMQAKEFDNAILKYNELLRLAKDNNINESDANARDKLEQSRKAKEDLEAKRREEQQRAEQKRKEEERRAEEARRLAEEKRKEEERLARMRGSVAGGAWIVKGSGHSDVLRGLTVYILRSKISPEDIKPALIKVRDDCVFWEKSNRETAKEYSTGKTEVGGSWVKETSDMREFVPEYRARERAMKQYGETVSKYITHGQDLSTELIYTLIRAMNRGCQGSRFALGYIGNDKAWPMVVARSIVAKTTTGLDGKYAIPNLKLGDYILYAVDSSRFYFIEWCIPVSIADEQPVNFDLHNDTAVLMLNK